MFLTAFSSPLRLKPVDGSYKSCEFVNDFCLVCWFVLTPDALECKAVLLLQKLVITIMR